MVKADILAFKMNSSDTESFENDIINYSKNSIILIHDLEKITVRYKPSNIYLKDNIIWYFKTKNHKYFYIFNTVKILKLFFLICWKFRPRVVWVENTDAAVIVGLLRKCRLCDESIYVPGDWLVNPVNKKNFFSYVANNLLFPINDYLACKLNDVVLNHTPRLSEARYKFWGRKIAKKEKLYIFNPRIKISAISPNKMSKNICFIGQMRKDSGLDLAIKALNKIRQEEDVSLIIIGPKTHHYEYFKQLSKQYHVEQYVKFLGFVETDQLIKILSDCFCGINILTLKQTYSYYTIPGKIMHYIQYMLPVIVTDGIGFFSSVVRDNELGLVIEPSETEFINSIFKIFHAQEQYRNNILKYVSSLPKIDIKELIEN
jgi:glycosyltransferase involved in cell wall biosynthesis